MSWVGCAAPCRWLSAALVSLTLLGTSCGADLSLRGVGATDGVGARRLVPRVTRTRPPMILVEDGGGVVAEQVDDADSWWLVWRGRF
jgi:hypothetical protein